MEGSQQKLDGMAGQKIRYASQREKGSSAGGPIVLGTATLAILIILSPLAIIPLANGLQGGGSAIVDDKPLGPCESSAKAIVTIHSTHEVLGVHYMLYLNDDLKAEGELAAGSSIIRTINITFPTDQSGFYHAVILATSNWEGLGAQSDQAILTIETDQIYPITLNI